MNPVSTRAGLIGSFLLVSVVFFGSIVSAAIVTRQHTTGNSNNITYTELALLKPTGTSVGDVLIANIAMKGGSAATTTAPSGWTLITKTDNDTNIGAASYYKVAGSSEGNSYTWLINSQTRATGGITAFSGVDSTNPIDVVDGLASRSTTASAPSVTTTINGAIIVTFLATDYGTNSSTDYLATPSGTTQIYRKTFAPFGPSIKVSTSSQAIVGATGERTSDINSNQSRDWVGQTIALRPQPTTNLSSGMVSYWKLDELSGNATDSASSNTLLNNNAVLFTSAKIGSGATFNPVSSQYLSISNSVQSGLDLSNSISIGAWVKFDSLPTADQEGRYIVSKWQDGSDPGGAYALSLYHNPVTTNLYFSIRGIEGWVDIMQNWTPTLGVWYYVAGTWDGTNSIGRVYVNGVQLGSDTVSSYTGIQTNTVGFKIGATENASGNPYHFQDGMIDEVGVWNRALSPSEVSALYNGGSGLQYPF